MEWKREGLLTDAEFERAKEKILGEEPHHEYACMPLCVPDRPLASEDMARGGDGQSARLFAIGVILDPQRVVVFWPSLHTVLRKVPKRGSQKGAKRAGPERPERPECFLLEVFGEKPPIKTARAARAARARPIWPLLNPPFLLFCLRLVAKTKKKSLPKWGPK